MKILKIIASLAFIIGLNFLCQCLVTVLNIKFPAPLIAMILLSLLMYFKIMSLDFVESGAKLLLDNIGLFFVSLLVGSFGYLFIIKDKLLIIFSIFIITSISLIIFTGLITQYLLARRVCKKRLTNLKE